MSHTVEHDGAGQAAGLREIAILVVEEIDVPEEVFSREARRPAGIEALGLHGDYGCTKGTAKKKNRYIQARHRYWPLLQFEMRLKASTLPSPVAKFQPLAAAKAGVYVPLLVDRLPFPTNSVDGVARPRPSNPVPKQFRSPAQLTAMSPVVMLWNTEAATELAASL